MAAEGWIHSVCENCFSSCGIEVRRLQGTVCEIKGDKNCPQNWGKLCAKGAAAIMGIYDPYRVKSPLKRTNPAKGIGVDAGWQEISWDEALDIMVEKLKAVRADDPRKLVISTFDHVALGILGSWGLTFGTPNRVWVGYYCGNYLHAAMYLTNGTFHSDFDLDYCNYCILLGNQHGFMVGCNPNIASQSMADARARGMKVVSVDPVCTAAASKSDEWVAIRPGTDGALILGMINILVNELGIYDVPFLKQRTNAPYLVKANGEYARDEETRKPLVWDSQAGIARSFNEPAGDVALEGRYEVGGIACQPAFQVLKEHVRSYSPEAVSKVTTIPTDVVRRLAREFGQAAEIGSTKTIEGIEFPYRPVAVNIYRGAGAHKHGALTALAVQILNLIVGAFYVPGGHRGLNLIGPGDSWGPGESADGLIKPPACLGHNAEYYDFEVRAPETLGLHELFPITTNHSPMYQMNTMNPDKFKLPYKPEVLITCRRNLMTTNVNRQSCGQTLKNIPFVVAFSMHLDEVTDFADLVFPEAHFLERLDLFPNRYYLNISAEAGYFYWGVRQPATPPAGQARRWIDVMWEIADRLGFLPDVYRLMNVELGLKEPYTLNPSKKYNWEEIYDRQAKSWFGPDKGLDWFRQNGYHVQKRTVKERYPGPFLTVRFPLYFENIQRAGMQLAQVTKELKLSWDTSDYQALPDWKPCPAYREESNGQGLYAVNTKLPYHTLSFTTQNPWLDELAENAPYALPILINSKTAARMG